MMLHPDEVLLQEAGAAADDAPPPCEHYAGDEKKLRKALALQDELRGAFDVTADMEDGAASGAEEETARLLSSILAEPRANTYRVGSRVHPADHPAFEHDVANLLAAKPKGLAYVTVPKIAGFAQFEFAISHINREAVKNGLQPPALQIMFEDELGLHDVFQIAAHPQVKFLAFGQMDFTSSHRGAIAASAMKSPGQFDHPLLRRAKLEISAAAHAYGKIPTHNPTTDFGSERQAFEDARRARNEFGFLRMWSIHPKQISQILQAFAPTAQEIEDSTRILLAAQAADWAPIADQGLLHDRASYRYFWSLLKRAKQSGAAVPDSALKAFFSNNS
jgi:citrate lyase subunit beta / citryl-CoA lyase